jgi:hypothetical protein
MSTTLGCNICTTSTSLTDELAVVTVAHLPIPVPFAYMLPSRLSRHTKLVEIQLSVIQVCAQA